MRVYKSDPPPPGSVELAGLNDFQFFTLTRLASGLSLLLMGRKIPLHPLVRSLLEERGIKEK